jgi:hypothetical protein
LAQSFDDVLKIQTGLGADSEIETLQALDDSPEAVSSFLTAHSPDLAPPGRACYSFTVARHTESNGTKGRGSYESGRMLETGNEKFSDRCEPSRLQLTCTDSRSKQR